MNGISKLGALALVALTACPARAETISVSSADCRRMVEHKADSDVAFTPGVDVRGRPVAPADVGGGMAPVVPEWIDIQIGIDLADRLGRRDSRNSQTPATRRVMGFEGKAPLGILSIKGNEAYWNGERLLPQDQVLLAEACRQSLAVLPEAKPTPPN
jgi:hypothetical protein